MKPPTESTLERPINQEAIVVHPDDFSAKIASMGDEALNQRFTLSPNAPREPRDGSDALDASATPEAGERAPIDVTAEQYTEFTFNTPDSPNIQKWLADNNIQPGEVVSVRILLPEGVVERRVSTDARTFFRPAVEDMPETDESEHAKIIGRKYPVGSSVIIGRNVYGPDGKTTGEKTPDTGWKVIGYGEKNGEPTTKVRKIEGSQVLDKEPTNAELREMQSIYGPEAQKPSINEAVARKTGHQELEAAGINEPEASEQHSEVDEITKPREVVSEPAVTQEAKVEEPIVEPEKPIDKKQERYNDIKKAMEAVIEEVSDASAGYAALDTHRLDDYAKAVYAGDNTEAQQVAKMSKKLISRTDLINRYTDLYKLREDLFTLRA